MEKEIALSWPRLNQTGVERDEFGVIAWGGADNVIRGMVIGTMIRHVFYGRGGCGSGQAPAVSALTIAMIKAAFLRSLMPEIGGAQLQTTSRIATTGTAIDLAAITMRTDEEHPPTAWSPAKALPEKQFHIRQHRSAK
jgi:hypothetical protein